MRFRAHEGYYIYNIQNRRGLLRCLSSIDGQCEGLNCGISNRYSSHAFRICGDKTKNSIKKPVRGTTGTINRFMHKVNLFPRTQVWANLWKAALLSLLCITTFSCSNELQMLFPEGPAGKSAYEVWVDGVNDGTIDWPKDRTDVNNFFLYLKGEDGKDGQDGADGKSAYEIWIAEVEAGLDNPKNPGTDWPKDQTDINDFWYYLTGADGKDGVTPNIGDNGHWWVGGEDTGIDAQGPQGPQGEPGEDGEDGEDGQDGQDGKPGTGGSTPSIYIDEVTKHWIINGEDTGIVAEGKDGESGDDGDKGQSAYELWVQEVKAGKVYKNGELWDNNKTTISDFWEFLRGNDGEDGEDGKPGQDGQDGATLILGNPNVIIQYYGDPDLKEYVDWKDGSVTYKVYDKNGKVVSGGTKVKGIPDSQSEYTTDEDGFITVPAKDLPKDKSYENIEVQVKIGEGEFETSANNTIVPAKMQVRLVVNDTKIPTVGLFGVGEDQAKPCVNLWFKVQRKKLDTTGAGDWDGIPAELGNTQKTVEIYEYKDGIEQEPTVVETRTQIEVAEDETGHNYNNCRVQIKRKFIYTELKYLDKTKVEASDDYWGEYNDDDFRYARIGIKECYGENIMLQSYIKLFPAQFTPTISEITRGNFYGDGEENDLVKLDGKLDVEKVNKKLFLATDYKKADQQEGGLDVYEPEEGNIDEAGEIFKINFSSSQESTNIVQSKVKIDGAFSARAVHIQSTVDLTNNQMANFYNLKLGNTAVSGGNFYLRINGDYVKAPEDAGENGIEIKVKETNEGND